jgi:hypothetical protein
MDVHVSLQRIHVFLNMYMYVPIHSWVVHVCVYIHVFIRSYIFIHLAIKMFILILEDIPWIF